jgi:hypothetical protein
MFSTSNAGLSDAMEATADDEIITAQSRVIHAVEPGYGGLDDHNFDAFIGLPGWICSFQPTHDVKQRPCQQG